jgi:ATP-dependent Clp protease ATP-binding subunit ClpA
VGTEHLVLGMLNQDRDGVAANILNAYEIDYKKFREGLVKMLEGQSGASGL